MKQVPNNDLVELLSHERITQLVALLSCLRSPRRLELLCRLMQAPIPLPFTELRTHFPDVTTRSLRYHLSCLETCGIVSFTAPLTDPACTIGIPIAIRNLFLDGLLRYVAA